MARRKKKKSRRRSSALSLLNVAEAYAYATILTEGLAGSSPYEFVTGGSDISTKTISIDPGFGMGGTSGMVVVGADSLSLAEMVTQPDLAFSRVNSNFKNNWQAMVIASLGTSVGFNVGRKLLRKPISNVNRNIFKPLGIGVKL